MPRRIPALLVGVAAVLSLAWAFALAPFQGPDEPSHFAYTQQLAETGHRPSVNEGDHPDSTQSANAIYFFNLDQLAGVSDARPAWTRLEEQRYAEIDAELGPPSEADGVGPNPLAKNPPLYYVYQVPAYFVGSVGSFWDRLLVMRLASGLLLLVTVLCAWLAAGELFARPWPRVIATGSVALLPQLTALSGTINADNLLIAVWSAFTVAALRLVRRGPSVGRIAALCLLAAASLLTHGRGVAILPALVIVIVVAVLRGGARPRRVALWLAPGAALLLVAVGIYRLVLAPSTGSYGGELTLSNASGMSPRGFASAVWQFYLPPLPFMGTRVGPPYGYRQMFIESFFGRFASLEVGFPAEVYTLIQLLCAVGLIGLLVAVTGRWAEVRERWAELVTLAAISISMLGLLHLASYRALVGSNDPLITGRYLLPLVLVFGLAVAFVVTSLPRRASALAGTIVLSGLLALNLAGLVLTVTRFYG